MSRVNGKSVRLEIESLGAMGDGIGHLDGKICFVPFSAPGDQLMIRPVQEKSSFVRGEILEIIVPGPGRKTPPCPLFGTCGACDWLHLDEDVQHQAKVATLGHFLRTEQLAFRDSPSGLGYRRLARMHLQPGKDQAPRFGFLRQQGKEVIDVTHCPILTESLNQVLTDLRQELLPALTGEAEIRIADGQSGPHLFVEATDPQSAAFYELANTLVPRQFAGISVLIDRSQATVAGQDSPVISGVDGKPFLAPLHSFGQANGEINRLVVQTAVEWATTGQFSRIMELFSGAGNLTVALAGAAPKLAAVETDPRACLAARENLAQRGITGATVYEGDALDMYGRMGDGFDLLVLDPPRTGHHALAQAMAKGKQRAVLYVSCNPQTLARDLEELKRAGYKMTRAAGFDMFPQTYHMEAAVLMER
jgi:23S rRNA (uracil1939-C5)-methyltransferase